MEKVKLTKSALADFIVWSTSRYNDYLGFGKVVAMLVLMVKPNLSKKKFLIECSGGNGEGHGNRYWRIKGRKGDYKYEVDCEAKTITGLPSNETIAFYVKSTTSVV